MRPMIIAPNRWGGSGMTLVELMIVVSIIGILAFIIAPKYGQIIQKSKEGSTKGNLGTIRSALSIYYGSLEGRYPLTLGSMTTNSKFLSSIPVVKVPSYHADSWVEIDDSPSAAMTDGGGWAYDNNSSDQNFGSVWVNCTHTDTKGTIWSSY